MELEFRLFPAFYLRAYCKDHGVAVEMQVQESKMEEAGPPIGLQLTPLRCPEGGMGPGAPCISAWTIATSARDVKISG